jgi:hypothetical protein
VLRSRVWSESARSPARGASGRHALRVEDTDRDELRRLALWLSRRRAVDEAVAVLTAYGPAASDRVHTHLDALAALLETEREAFDAICADAPRRTQLPLPESLPDALTAGAEPSGRGATVHSIGAARDRHLI